MENTHCGFCAGWGILVLSLCSAVKVSSKQHLGQIHDNISPQLLGRRSSGCLRHARAPAQSPVDSLSLKAPACYCCPGERSLSSSSWPRPSPYIGCSCFRPSPPHGSQLTVLKLQLRISGSLKASSSSGRSPTSLHSLPGSWPARDAHCGHRPRAPACGG